MGNLENMHILLTLCSLSRDFITDQEIKAVLNSNPEGVTLKFIADKFKNRVKNDEVKKGLIASLRKLSITTDKKTYRLRE